MCGVGGLARHRFARWEELPSQGTHALHPAALPLLFPPADLKPLYADSSKAALLGALFARLEASLLECGALPPLAGEDGDGERKPTPQALVW